MVHRFTLATAVVLSATAASAAPPLLEPGKPVEREIKAGESHDYHLKLKRNRHLVLVADQRGFDVVIRLYAPDGELLEWVDDLGTTGIETLSTFTSSSGFHRVEIVPYDREDPDPGTYTIEIARLEKAARTPAGKVDQVMARWDRPGSPGAAVAVVRDEKVVLTRGYGLADLEHEIPITPSTVFDIASVSKQFTGLAVAMLVKQGRLSLDDDYRKFLPEMPDYGPTVTIDHLVHHTSGIRDWPGTLAVAGWQMGDVISFEQILTLARNLRELNFLPGDEFTYSNTNYNLLAETVARVTGQTFQDWTRENLFQPLGMKSTHFQHDETTVIKNRAYGYDPAGDDEFKHAPNDLTAMGSSSLFTTIKDLARWAINFESAKVGGAEAISMMHRQGVLNNGEPNSYAFGVRIDEYRGLPAVEHSGGWAAFRTVLLRFPEQRFSVIVLANSSGFDSYAAALEIAEIYLEEEMVAAEKTAEVTAERDTAGHPPATETDAIDPETLDGYVGNWQIGDLLVAVERDGDRLMSRPLGRPAVELVIESEDSFHITGTGARLVFRRNDEGDVVGVTFHGSTEIEGKRAEKAEPTAEELAQYAGRYYSSELEAFYDVAVEDHGLVARNRRHGEIKLRPTTVDAFSGNRWFLGKVEFERDEAGAVETMRVTVGARVRKLRFSRRTR